MIRTAVLALAVLLLISLPSLPVGRIPGSALTPRIAVAGGSPDETLAPHDSTPLRTRPVRRTDHQLTALQRWRIVVSLLRTFAIRL